MKTHFDMLTKTYQYALFLAVVAFVMASCRPDDFYPLGDRTDRSAQFPGTYQLQAVTQTDLDAQEKGFPAFAVEQDITDAYPFQQMTLTLQADGSFTVNAGDAPNIIGFENGTWSLDNAQFPSTVIFTSGSESSELGIRFLNGLDTGTLTLEKVNTSEGKALTEYLFEFQK